MTRSWWPWGKKELPQEPAPPVEPPPVDIRYELEKLSKARYEIFQKLKVLKSESIRKHEEDPQTYPTPLAYFYQEGVTTKEERGMYAEVLTMLVIKQAARDDKRFAFVQDAFCTDKHSVSDRFGGDVIVVTSFGFWIPLQIKRTQQEASVFREESRRRGELVPVVVFNDRHSERQLLESVFQAISEVVPTETESVGRR